MTVEIITERFAMPVTGEGAPVGGGYSLWHYITTTVNGKKERILLLPRITLCGYQEVFRVGCYCRVEKVSAELAFAVDGKTTFDGVWGSHYVDLPYRQLRGKADACGHVLISVTIVVKGECLSLFLQSNEGAIMATQACSNPLSPFPSCRQCKINPAPHPREDVLTKSFRGEPFARDHVTKFTIKVDGKDFWVHPVILIRDSPVFESMLLPDKKEAQEECVTVVDTTPDDMRRFLTAVYSSWIEEYGKNAE